MNAARRRWRFRPSARSTAKRAIWSRAIENLSRALELHQQLWRSDRVERRLDDLGQALWLLGRAERRWALPSGRWSCGAASATAAGRIAFAPGRKSSSTAATLDAAAYFGRSAAQTRKRSAAPRRPLEALGSRSDARRCALSRARFKRHCCLRNRWGPSAQLGWSAARRVAAARRGCSGKRRRGLLQARELAVRLSDRRALAEIMRLPHPLRRDDPEGRA